MGKIIETLKKVNYTTLSQFVEDINRNFAIIQNSPLYKGIPGDAGDPGNIGPQGQRGSEFFFLKNKISQLIQLLQNDYNYVQQFKNISINDITLELINDIYSERSEFFYTLFPQIKGVGFVDNDIIVLPNSIMIQFDKLNNKFVSTGVSFNENQTFLSSIENKIEEYVKAYVDNNPHVLALQNIFERYLTYGKNYASTSHMTISSKITNGTVFTPHLGNNKSGILIDNHKYFGFSDKEFPVSNRGTLVLGSMRNFVQMVEKTISSDGQNSTTSAKYAIGPNNIPVLTLVQNDGNSGIIIGYKGWTTLKNFGQIYKEISGTNIDGPLVIKSHMGAFESNLPNEDYSKLSLFKNMLTYDKFAKFLDNVEIKKDLIIGENLQSTFLRSGEYLSEQGLSVDKQKHTLEFGYWNGKNDFEGSLSNQFKNIRYKNFISNVLITDDKGNLSNKYMLETKPFEDVITGTNLAQIVWKSQNPTTAIPTTEYINKLIDKLNAIQSYVSNNYWHKDQWFVNNVSEFIPGLTTQKLIVNSVNGGVVTMFGSGNIKLFELSGSDLKLGSSNALTQLISKRIQLNEFSPDNVLTVGADKTLDTQYVRETRVINQIVDASQIEQTFTETNKYVTSYYVGQLARLIAKDHEKVKRNYWTKQQFEENIIPKLYLKEYLKIGNSEFSKTKFNLKSDSGNIAVANTLSLKGRIINLDSGGLTIKNGMYKNKIISIDKSGYFEYKLEILNNLPNDLTFSIIEDPEIKLLTANHLNWIINQLQNIINTNKTDYWRKVDFVGFKIPNLDLSNNLNVNGDVRLGIIDNPFIRTTNSANTMEIGKSGDGSKIIINSNDINFKSNHKNAVLVTDSNGNLIDNHKHDKSLKDTNVTVPDSTDEKYVSMDLTDAQKKDDKILTGIQLNVIQRIINNIRMRFKNTFNRKETIDTIYDHMPVGSIIMWTLASSKAAGIEGKIPKGWAVCDGSKLPNSDIYTPNMLDMFVRGTNNIQETINSYGSDTIKIEETNLPDLTHTHDILPSGEHEHKFGVDINYDATLARTNWDGGKESGREFLPIMNASFLAQDTSKKAYIGMESDSGKSTHFFTTDGKAFYSVYSLLNSLKLSTSYSNNDISKHTHNVDFAHIGNTVEAEPIKIIPRHYKVIYIMKFDTRKLNGTDFNSKYILDNFITCSNPEKPIGNN